MDKGMLLSILFFICISVESSSFYPVRERRLSRQNNQSNYVGNRVSLYGLQHNGRFSNRKSQLTHGLRANPYSLQNPGIRYSGSFINDRPSTYEDEALMTRVKNTYSDVHDMHIRLERIKIHKITFNANLPYLGEKQSNKQIFFLKNDFLKNGEDENFFKNNKSAIINSCLTTLKKNCKKNQTYLAYPFAIALENNTITGYCVTDRLDRQINHPETRKILAAIRMVLAREFLRKPSFWWRNKPKASSSKLLLK